MKQSGIHHRKTLRLMRILSIRKAMAVGLMEMLWHWAGDNALSGDVTGLEKDIEAGLEWWGDPGTLIPAMVEAEWLDEVDGRVVIHDWAEECPEYIRKRMNRKRKRPTKTYPVGHCPPLSADVRQRLEESAAAHPMGDSDPGALPFAKDLPETNQRKSKKDPLYTAAFETAWKQYKTRGNKRAASRAYRDAINYVANRDDEPRGDPHEWMLGRVTLWTEINAGRDMQYWKHFERWLRDGAFDFDEDTERAAAPGGREQQEEQARQDRVRALMEQQQ